MTEVKKTSKKAFPGGAGPGRPKGVLNRATVEFRETIRALLEDNSENVSLWLSQVASEDPAKALDMLAKLAEYAAPKLARTEHVGDADKPIQTVIRWSQD